MSSLSLWAMLLLIYDRKAGQRTCQVLITRYLRTEFLPLPTHECIVLAVMLKVSWSCVEVACCVPNCSTPTFNPKISHMITANSPLAPHTPISACTPNPSIELGVKIPSPCCERQHKHFLYSIVLPKGNINASTTYPEIEPPRITSTQNSSTTSLDSAPIFTPSTPPERPSLRARRDTLSKLKIPESPPLSQEARIPRSQPSPAPPSSRYNNRSGGGASLYPDMFLPTPSQSHLGARNTMMNPLSAAYNMSVSPMSANSPLFSRDVLAMSPISPLMFSNNPSPIMAAA